jgi:DNA invertase Pin-like site-specific DNA recombinase
VELVREIIAAARREPPPLCHGARPGATRGVGLAGGERVALRLNNAGYSALKLIQVERKVSVKFAGYVRVSDVGGRDKQTNGRQFLSPTEQRQKITDWARLHEHEVVEVVEDLNRSGGTERENLEKLVRRVEAGEIDGIAVARLNRFSRSLAQATTYLDRIKRADGQFVAVEDSFDSGTDTGKLLMRILLSFAEYELDTRRTASRAAVAARIKGGRHWGKRPRLGFELDAEGRLKHSRHAETVRQCFERYAEGEGARTLARWLTNKGVKTPQGEEITSRYVQDMLRADVYVGVLRGGEHVSEHDAAIVDRELWEAVQARHQERRPRCQTGTALGGLVRCWSCRHVMRSYRNGGKQAYGCRNEKCGRPTSALEERLLPLAEFSFWCAVGDLRSQRSEEDERRAHLEQQRDQATRAVRNLAAATKIAELEPQEIAEVLATWKHKREKAERALRDLKAEVTLPEERTLRRDWPKMPLEQKRELFQLLFTAIVVKPPEKKRDHSVPIEARTRFLRRAQAEDLPRSGRTSASLPFPPFTDRSYWPPVAVWLHPDDSCTIEHVLGEPDRRALTKQYTNWLATEYGGTWG